jgi:type II secretory pathway component PulF
MTVLADQIVAFHTQLLHLSELGFPIGIEKVDSPKSLGKVLADYQNILEGRIARGARDPQTLLSDSSLPINYCQALELWLRDPNQPQAFQLLIEPASNNNQLRWQFRFAWLFPIVIAILGFAITMLTLNQLVPHLDDLYARSGRTVGPLFDYLKTAYEHSREMIAGFGITIVTISALVWKSRTRPTVTGFQQQKRHHHNHLEQSSINAQKAQTILLESASKPSSTEQSLSLSQPPVEQDTPIYQENYAFDSPLRRSLFEKPFSINEPLIFQSSFEQLPENSQALLTSLARFYTNLSQYHKKRYTQRLQPFLIFFIGGSFTLLAALTLFLPYAEFMWIVAMPEGVRK